MEIGFPDSSFGGLMWYTASNDAASRNIASLLRWRPGQMLKTDCQLEPLRQICLDY
jgi:hypothetical protein